jgi:hypothetical protein
MSGWIDDGDVDDDDVDVDQSRAFKIQASLHGGGSGVGEVDWWRWSERT